MSLIHRRLQPIQSRQQYLWLMHCAAWGLLVAASTALVYGTSQLWQGRAPSASWLLALILAGPVLGSLTALVRRRDFRHAAIAVDTFYGLKDRATTALAFLEKA